MRTHDPLMPVLRQITNRDRQLLGLLYDHKILTTEQIATALFPNLDTATSPRRPVPPRPPRPVPLVARGRRLLLLALHHRPPRRCPHRRHARRRPTAPRPARRPQPAAGLLTHHRARPRRERVLHRPPRPRPYPSRHRAAPLVVSRAVQPPRRVRPTHPAAAPGPPRRARHLDQRRPRRDVLPRTRHRHGVLRGSVPLPVAGSAGLRSSTADGATLSDATGVVQACRRPVTGSSHRPLRDGCP
jgi:hypothetical protein